MSSDAYTPATCSDEQHMHAYALGDERAFALIFRAYAPRLRAYFVCKGLRRQDADDLVQQTFLQVHRARDRYQSGQPLRPWLFTIARNQRLDHCRRQRRRPELLCEPEARVEPEARPDSERLQALTAALAQLPREQRTLIDERWMQERSWNEIATRSGALPGALRVRAHRVCVQLRGLLEEAA